MLNLFVLLACAKQAKIASNQPLIESAPTLPQVEIAGALFKMMHQGDRGPNAELLSVQDQPHLYGLGAMEGLDGEVTIWDGQVWISRPADQSRVQTTQTANATDSATLLVHSTVPQWTQITLTSSLDDSSLEVRIQEHAKAHGLSTEEAFPFTIVGQSKQTQWHVIDGTKITDEAHGHEAHMQTAIKGSIENETVHIVGFYSPKHKGVFTHHDSTVHSHLISKEQNLTGHIDSLSLHEGAILSLPTMAR